MHNLCGYTFCVSFIISLRSFYVLSFCESIDFSVFMKHLNPWTLSLLSEVISWHSVDCVWPMDQCSMFVLHSILKFLFKNMLLMLKLIRSCLDSSILATTEKSGLRWFFHPHWHSQLQVPPLDGPGAVQVTLGSIIHYCSWSSSLIFLVCLIFLGIPGMVRNPLLL